MLVTDADETALMDVRKLSIMPTRTADAPAAEAGAA